MRSSVVLPQPDGPIKATNSPAATSNETGRSAVTSPNRRETARMKTGAALNGCPTPG